MGLGWGLMRAKPLISCPVEVVPSFFFFLFFSYLVCKIWREENEKVFNCMNPGFARKLYEKMSVCSDDKISISTEISII